ncbi:MAG: diheme cytochrome c [Pseudomonadota bacterium]
MFKDHINSRWPFAVAVLLMSITVIPAHADDDDRGRGMSSMRSAAQAGDENRSGKRGRMPLVINAKWKDECGSCHMAYPPRFLSAESWRAVMAGLDKHFGSDASVDAATAIEIGAFLEQNASTKQRRSSTGNEPPLRITETRWFQSEHRKMDNKWKDPRVKSPSNCAACHTQAESGSFKERDIKVPK